MIRDLITNLAIFTAFLFLVSHLFQNNFPSMRSPLKIKIRTGINHGILGVIVMFFALPITPVIFVDFRYIAIVTAAYLGGFPAALVSGIIIAIARMFFFGGITSSSIAGFFMCATMGVVCGIISEKTKGVTKWVALHVVAIGIFFATLYLLIPNRGLLYTIYLQYSLIAIAAAFFITYLTEYLARSNKFEKQLKESEERNRRLVELLPDALIVHSEGTIIYANKNATQLLTGNAVVSIIGKDVVDFVHPDSIDFVRQRLEHLNKIMPTDVGLAEEKLVTLDNKVFDAEVTAASIVYHGKPSILTVFRDITDRKIAEHELKEANKKLALLSSTDGLTGIANRRTFDETLRKEWDRCQREQVPLSLIMFDIDHFKLYNDTYGHDGGDDCLRKVAKAAEKVAQRPGDLTARYGGEEFGVVLPHTNQEGALLIAEHVRSSIEKLCIPHKNSMVSNVVTSSVGVATCLPKVGISAEFLLKQADQALYLAKNNGRNRVEINHPVNSKQNGK